MQLNPHLQHQYMILVNGQFEKRMYEAEARTYRGWVSQPHVWVALALEVCSISWKNAVTPCLQQCDRDLAHLWHRLFFPWFSLTSLAVIFSF